MDPPSMDPLASSEKSHASLDGSGRSSKKSGGYNASYEMVPLPPDFRPTELDVICARGKDAYNHPGNIRFRELVQDQLHNYQSSTSKMAKSQIVREIIESVLLASPNGGFVKKVNGQWFDVGERARREKTGQQIRDLLHTQYKSSTKAKALSRKRLRKSMSANCATKIATQDAVFRSARGNAVLLSSSRGNSKAAAAAAARSALGLPKLTRRNSEPDMATLAARAAVDDPEEADLHESSPELGLGSSSLLRDSLFTIRETAAALAGTPSSMMSMEPSLPMTSRNRIMNMNTPALGFGAAYDVMDGFPPLSATSTTGQLGLLQHAQQRQQLSDLSGLLEQPPTQASNIFSPSAGLGGSPFASNFSSNLSSSNPSPFLPSSFGGLSVQPFDATPSLGMTLSSIHGNTTNNLNSLNTPPMGMTMGYLPTTQNNQTFPNRDATHHSDASSSSSSFASPTTNTRPQDSSFTDIFSKSGRMHRSSVPTTMEDIVRLHALEPDPIVDCGVGVGEDESIFKGGPIKEDPCDEESERSFEEAIDDICCDGLEDPHQPEEGTTTTAVTAVAPKAA